MTSDQRSGQSSSKKKGWCEVRFVQGGGREQRPAKRSSRATHGRQRIETEAQDVVISVDSPRMPWWTVGKSGFLNALC